MHKIVIFSFFQKITLILLCTKSYFFFHSKNWNIPSPVFFFSYSWPKNKNIPSIFISKEKKNISRYFPPFRTLDVFSKFFPSSGAQQRNLPCWLLGCYRLLFTKREKQLIFNSVRSSQIGLQSRRPLRSLHTYSYKIAPFLVANVPTYDCPSI